MSGLQRAVIRHTLGLVPSVEDMTNWGGDYLNGQAVGASCSDNSAIDDLDRLFFRVRLPAMKKSASKKPKKTAKKPKPLSGVHMVQRQGVQPMDSSSVVTTSKLVLTLPTFL
jgi:hypothetical protein